MKQLRTQQDWSHMFRVFQFNVANNFTGNVARHTWCARDLAVALLRKQKDLRAFGQISNISGSYNGCFNVN